MNHGKVYLDVPESSIGIVIERFSKRGGELITMSTIGNRAKLEYIIPERGLIGYRSTFLTDTRGEGIMHATFHGYSPKKEML